MILRGGKNRGKTVENRGFRPGFILSVMGCRIVAESSAASELRDGRGGLAVNSRNRCRL
jgi:hypothetical protein